MIIIDCVKCKARYRFDDSLLTGEGLWVRCMSCERIFFMENPSYVQPAPETLPAPEMPLPPETPPAPEISPVAEESTERDALSEAEAVPEEEPPEIHLQADHEADLRTERVDDLFVSDSSREGAFAPEPETFFKEAAVEEPAPEESIETPERPAKRFSLSRVLLLIVLLAILAGVASLWIFPDAVRKIADRAPFLKPLAAITGGGTSSTAEQSAGRAVEFTSVREYFKKNWVVGNILVIEGQVLNKNSFAISALKIRGKILNQGGETLGSQEVYCGNVLGEKDLGGLAADELLKELLNPAGKVQANKNIAPQGTIPFMIIFIDPPKEASAFTLDLAEVQKASSK
ncbi:MAG: zinc-ribbon domain-containing protein [Deltaproteobacteria bacterium]|nr:zinc-ribbon domain-containing protein [Deltaproteobacteria bacterium]